MMMSGAVGRVVTVVRNGAWISVMQNAVDSHAAVYTRVPIVGIVPRVGIFLQRQTQRRQRRMVIKLRRRTNLQGIIWVVVMLIVVVVVG